MGKTSTGVQSQSGISGIKQGRVKWFNSQAGYGFIEMTQDGGEKIDLFVHHSALTVNGDMFRFLVEGEYVEYIVKHISKSGEDKITASKVTGIGGGPLQCETRHNRRLSDSKRDAQHRSPRKGNSSPHSERLWQVVKEQFVA